MKDEKQLIEFISRSLDAGIPITKIAEYLNKTPAGISYIIKTRNLKTARKRSKTGESKTLSDLTIHEKLFLANLLEFIPADLISRWLNLTFK